MAARPFLMTIFTLALLLPALYRRHQRRSGATGAPIASRGGRLFVGAMAVLILVGVTGGIASAENGDRDGAKTGTHVENVIPKDTSSSDQVPVLAAQVEKQRVAINTTWLMVGGILVLFMQAGFALVETGFTRAKNASHTMMMNMVIFALGVVGWWVCGYAFMFGATDYHGVLGLTALGTPWHVGDWNLLAHDGFFLGGNAYD